MPARGGRCTLESAPSRGETVKLLEGQEKKQQTVFNTETRKLKVKFSHTQTELNTHRIYFFQLYLSTLLTVGRG